MKVHNELQVKHAAYSQQSAFLMMDHMLHQTLFQSYEVSVGGLSDTLVLLKALLAEPSPELDISWSFLFYFQIPWYC